MCTVSSYLDRGQIKLTEVAKIKEQIKAGATNISTTIFALSTP